MTIFCRICKHSISSSRPVEKAQSDVLEQMSRHLVDRHRGEAQAFGEALVAIPKLLSTYLLLKRFVDIPAGEAELMKSFDENEAALLEIFDIEPETASN